MSDWWPAVAAALVAFEAALAFTLRHGLVLHAYTSCSYFLLMLLATGIAGLNAVQSRQAIRLFWSFLAAGFGLWSLNEWFWIYYTVWFRAGLPNLSWSDPPLFLHIVLFMAAVLTRPHLSTSGQKLYRKTLDFLLILFFCVFIYAYAQFPYHHGSNELARYATLYFAENVVFLAVLGWIISRAHSPWKTIYWHLFGASAVYALGSLIGNSLFIARRFGDAGLYHLPLGVALCWFIWATLLGRKLTPALEHGQLAGTDEPTWVSLLAMIAVVAIPFVGLWELFRVSEPSERRAVRLAIVLVSVVLLALSALIKEYLEHHGLSADLSRAVLQRTQMEEERLELSGRLIHAQEEERGRIARDLHDDLNQRLGLLAFGLAQLSGRVQAEETQRNIQELWEQATGLSKDLHRLSHELHPAALENLGLVVAARALCAEVSKQQKVNVEFSEENIPVQPSAGVSLCLFRILQECLNNVCKHSNASAAWVRLTGAAGGIRLTVQDNGIGFDPVDKRNLGGLGLLSMNERLRLVGGTIGIDSVPSGGTSVNVWVPINAAEAPGDASSEQPQWSSKSG